MATSGTVGQTRFSLGDMIDHALRRCKLNPAVVLNAELVSTARAAIYLILTSLANRGLNLWRVEHGFLGLTPGTNKYLLPSGVLRIPDLNFVTNSVGSGTQTVIANGYRFALDSAAITSRVGFKPTSDFTGVVTFLTSTDGAAYSSQLVLPSASYSAGTWYWFELPVHEAIEGVEVTCPTAMTLTEVAVSTANYIIPMWQWNRDDYSMQPTRNQSGRPSTNYYFDRQSLAQIWVWPVPTNGYDHIEYWLHRQVQDVSLLTDDVDVPQHWLNAATWLLAREFCAVVPGIDPSAVQIVMAESERVGQDSEAGETDGSSIFIQPRISGYSR